MDFIVQDWPYQVKSNKLAIAVDYLGRALSVLYFSGEDRPYYNLFHKVSGLNLWFFKDRAMNDGCLRLFGCWSSGRWFLTSVSEFCWQISLCCCTVSAMHYILAVIISAKTFQTSEYFSCFLQIFTINACLHVKVSHEAGINIHCPIKH